MKVRTVLAPLAWMWMIDTAFAQTAAPAAVAPASPMASMLQGLVGLVIVIGVIFAAAWLVKRVGPRARSGGVVRIVGGASVGPREKVVVVRFGHQTLLLGVAQGHVSLLHATDTIDEQPDDANAPPAPRFIDRLRAARSNG